MLSEKSKYAFVGLIIVLFKVLRQIGPLVGYKIAGYICVNMCLLLQIEHMRAQCCILSISMPGPWYLDCTLAQTMTTGTSLVTTSLEQEVEASLLYEPLLPGLRTGDH